MSELEHLSYSSINLFLTCSENWRRKYVEKEATPSSPALVFGSAFHNTIENHIRFRHTPLIDDQTRQDAKLVDFWPNAWNEQLESNADCDWGMDTPEQHFNEGVKILTTPDVQTLADSLTPAEDGTGLWIERKIELRVPGVPIPVIGYMDIMTDDGVPGDFKTSSRRWYNGKAEEEIQPLVYLAALNQAGIHVPDLRFRHYIVTKTKNPEVQILEHTHSFDQILWLFELIQKVWSAIQAEQFVINPGAWLCNPKYCGYWTTCRGKGMT